MDLAVLADLASSMFAATFMILLIFLSLVQRTAHLPERTPVEATSAFHLVRHRLPSAGGLLDFLRLYGRPGSGLSLALFDDGIEVTDGRATRRISPAPAAELPAGEIRLYVFSNRFYNQLVSALQARGRAFSEMSVPLALSDPDRPDSRWSAEFLDLSARDLPVAAFRSRLAALLQGAPGPHRDGRRSGPAGSAGGFPRVFHSDLLARILRWVAFLAALVPPAAGALAFVWIERRRLWPDFRIIE